MRRRSNADTAEVQRNGRPPRDGLVRALRPGIELRAAEDAPASGMPTLAGHFSVFNEWTEINSMFEGHFLERVSPGAYKKTFKEQRDSMRCLFQHGMDPVVADKPLGPIDRLEEDGTGAAYEVPMLDTSYNRDLVPGLEAGLYGASFRFRVMREEYEEEPGASADNPNGLPQRTIKEAEVREFGPVTFPAYAGATAGVRSLTDEFLMGRFASNEKQAARLLSFAGMRADEGDVGPLARMLALAAEFVEETDDDNKREAMSGVVISLTGLIGRDDEESDEDAPDAPDAEEADAEEADAGDATPTPPEEADAPAPEDDTTSQEEPQPDAAAETDEPDDVPETDDAGERSTSPQGPTPLYPARGRKEPSWLL